MNPNNEAALVTATQDFVRAHRDMVIAIQSLTAVLQQAVMSGNTVHYSQAEAARAEAEFWKKKSEILERQMLGI